MAADVDLVVVGGGITGLAAAWEARQRGAEVVVLEASPQAGGKIRTSTVAGIELDEAADAFLVRVPEARQLCRELGIEAELITPVTGRAYVWVDGTLRVLPREQLLGVPTDLDAVAETGILSSDGLARARQDLDAPDDRPDGDADESVSALVRRRLGDEALDRLVAPLVGGIWAGDCEHLSLQVATPNLAEARRRGPSLVRGAAELRAAATTTPTPSFRDRDVVPEHHIPVTEREGDGPAEVDRPAEGQTPVFLAPRGGMGRLIETLVERLDGRVVTDSAVTAIEPAGPHEARRWRVEPRGILTDAVVVTTPAFAAAPLVAPHAPAAAELLSGIGYSSVVLVTLAVRRDGIDHPLDGSGMLVPPSSGRLLTACSWVTSKWAHLAGDGSTVLLRASAGRDGDDRALRLDDDTLVKALCDDLADTMGLRDAPSAVRVSSWSRSFPQPRPGHLDRVAGIERGVRQAAPGLAVTGAWARGVGIPACIRAGRRAAADLLDVPSSPTP
jgi:protoporphyrinogen/coproporphyrinogen III oxidase